MFWFDPWRIGQAAWDNSVRLGETSDATQAVLRHRGCVIEDAMRSPATADMAELSRMVPEKMLAFSRAGQSLADDWWAMQSDWIAQCQDLGAMAFAGRAPNAATVERMGKRGAKIAARMVESGGRALAPIHASVTANQRRLKRK